MNTNCVIRNVNEHVGETVTIGAWINNKRSSGKIQFCSCVMEPDISKGLL